MKPRGRAKYLSDENCESDDIIWHCASSIKRNCGKWIMEDLSVRQKTCEHLDWMVGLIYWQPFTTERRNEIYVLFRFSKSGWIKSHPIHLYEMKQQNRQLQCVPQPSWIIFRWNIGFVPKPRKLVRVRLREQWLNHTGWRQWRGKRLFVASLVRCTLLTRSNIIVLTIVYCT